MIFMGITFKHSGDFLKTETFLKRNHDLKKLQMSVIETFGKKGLDALKEATPVDTGQTASSWYYEIEQKKGALSLVFKNSNIVNGVNIAIILQYGHGTRNGGYVTGVDYINPTLKPIFDGIAEELWKEVTKP